MEVDALKEDHDSKDDVGSEEQNFWSTNGEVIIRHHRVPRDSLFIPTDDNCPMPLKYLDVFRRTYTDLENKEEASISDLWNLDGSRRLSDSWRGKTVFEFIRPPPKKNHYWVDGLEVRKQKTSRPGHIWPKV